MMRLTDEELAKLERLDREASDDWTGIYDASDGVSTLTTGRITLTSDATDARDDVFMACAARNALPSLLAEVRALRGFTEDVYRVIDCEDCNLGIVYYQDGTSDPCLICGGLEGVVSP